MNSLKEDGTTAYLRRFEDWHFAYLRGVHRPWVGSPLQQSHVEFLRDVSETRQLVDSGASRKDDAGGGVHHLLEREEAVALDEPTLHLADIDGGVQTLSEVHDDVGTHHLIGQSVSQAAK